MKTAPPHGYEEWYRIRSHEVDHRKMITVPSLLMLMQEASMQNALSLKISVWDLEDQKISWVLLRKELTINRLPDLGENIKVVTYPAGFDRVFAYRDFWVYDEQEQLIAYAASTWTLLNTETRRLQRIPVGISDFDLPEGSVKLPLPDTKIKSPENYADNYNYSIRHFDLDWNDHVNNVVLSKLMLQSLSDEIFKSQIIQNFNFQIKNECYPDEKIQIELENQTDGFHHRILGHDKRIVATGQSFWK